MTDHQEALGERPWFDYESKMAKLFPPPKWTQIKFHWMRDPIVCACHELTHDECPDYNGPNPGVMYVIG